MLGALDAADDVVHGLFAEEFAVEVERELGFVARFGETEHEAVVLAVERDGGRLHVVRLEDLHGAPAGVERAAEPEPATGGVRVLHRSTTCCGVRPPPMVHWSFGRDVMMPPAPPSSSRTPSSPPPNAGEYPVPRTPALAPVTDGLFGLTRSGAHSRCVATMSESMRAFDSGVALAAQSSCGRQVGSAAEIMTSLPLAFGEPLHELGAVREARQDDRLERDVACRPCPGCTRPSGPAACASAAKRDRCASGRAPTRATCRTAPPCASTPHDLYVETSQSLAALDVRRAHEARPERVEQHVRLGREVRAVHADGIDPLDDGIVGREGLRGERRRRTEDQAREDLK